MNVNGKKLNIFQDLHQKVETTISGWNFTHLNLAGKLILINSILIAYASHIMVTYWIPQKVLKSISSSLLRYWWKSSTGKKPVYWQKREFLEEHKHKSGVGLKNMRIVNQAILFKQAWRISQNSQLLISKFFKAKYYPN